MLNELSNLFLNSPLATEGVFYISDEPVVIEGIVSTTEISEQLGHAVTLDTQHAFFFVGIDEAKPLCRGIKARIDGTLYQVLSIRNSDGMAEISLCLA